MTAVPLADPAEVVLDEPRAVCPTHPDGTSVHSVPAAIARLARAALSDAHDRMACTAGELRTTRAEGAELVTIAVSPDGDADQVAQLARTVLDAGIAVLTVPPSSRPQPQRIGIGHDGSRSAAAALAVVRRIAEASRGQMTRLDIAYVDGAATSACELDGDMVASRREAAIEWWLAELAAHVPAPVRPLRRVGDPADALAELSHDLDLLVVGTRGRAPLRRALTGSVSRKLIATARCPLLIVPPQAAVATAAM